jgi:hypothetical protein
MLVHDSFPLRRSNSLQAGATRASVATVAGYEDRSVALLTAQIGGVEAQH